MTLIFNSLIRFSLNYNVKDYSILEGYLKEFDFENDILQ